jgi:four helix bundle protein
LGSDVTDQGDVLKERTKRFALDVVALLMALPNTEPAITIKRQVVKAATSVAANYRAARRARSHAEFTARISVVAEEADETLFWLDFVADAQLARSADLSRLQREAGELTAIFSACVGTARRKSRINQR